MMSENETRKHQGLNGEALDASIETAKANMAAPAGESADERELREAYNEWLETRARFLAMVEKMRKV